MAQLTSRKLKSRVLKCVVGLVFVLVCVIAYVALNTPAYVLAHSSEDASTSLQAQASTDSFSTGVSPETPDVIVVHIDGAVVAPGVYELPEESRVQDGVAAAGGLTEEADTSTINLAAKLQDGQKVQIPKAGESSGETGASSSSESAGQSLVNINTATAEELDSLPGVGSATAESIIQDRDSLGPFSSTEDLMRVSGIGEKKFAKLKDYICV